MIEKALIFEWRRKRNSLMPENDAFVLYYLIWFFLFFFFFFFFFFLFFF